MDFEWDEAKRAATSQLRGLDFTDCYKIFAGITLTIEDDRRDYGEVRYQTLGRLGDEVIMVVWTPRGHARRVISMRKGDGRERARYYEEVA